MFPDGNRLSAEKVEEELELFHNIEKSRSYLVNLSVNYSRYIALCSVFQINVSVVLGISSPLIGSYISLIDIGRWLTHALRSIDYSL